MRAEFSDNKPNSHMKHTYTDRVAKATLKSEMKAECKNHIRIIIKCSI